VASIPGKFFRCKEFSLQRKYLREGSELIYSCQAEQGGDEKSSRAGGPLVQAVDCPPGTRGFSDGPEYPKIYLNEIKHHARIHAISMYPKLWAASASSMRTLIDQLIQLGLERHEDKRGISTAGKRRGSIFLVVLLRHSP